MGETALHCCCGYYYDEAAIMRLLLKKRAIELKNREGKSPLIVAIERICERTMSALVARSPPRRRIEALLLLGANYGVDHDTHDLARKYW